jgi:methionyl aminopeptidase
MTILTDAREIRKIRECGLIIRKIFERLNKNIEPGISTAELDRAVAKMIADNGAEPAFKGYRGYPAVICASINEEVVHGIPSESRILKEGDIVGIDVGVKKNGYFTDGARTYAVGKVSDGAMDLMDATAESLKNGIKEAVAGNKLFDISNAIETTVRNRGYQEVRAFVGHGIGKELHEPPEVPNWGEKGKGIRLVEGLLLAIEPMVNKGTRDIEVLKDGWTAVTRDRKLSAHFEHTIIVGKNRAEALT